VWPDHATPERNALWRGDPDLSRLDALKTALQGERRGFDFYCSVWGTTKDPEIAAMANEFVKEEGEHVAILERWIEREAYVVRSAKEAAAPDIQA
jgi:rubrerythrin